MHISYELAFLKCRKTLEKLFQHEKLLKLLLFHRNLSTILQKQYQNITILFKMLQVHFNQSLCSLQKYKMELSSTILIRSQIYNTNRSEKISDIFAEKIFFEFTKWKFLIFSKNGFFMLLEIELFKLKFKYFL